ncbi:hypothetical protein SAMN04489735_103439 [Aneurinibacillus thermoaerophilus]|uniref:Uncharacterized protein n=1 Tax=Aneurinibacillus thermoaerophilus TaxID=143495 RepID=A0A1G8DMB4_ANETH|nr:hypothetical protein [Aneurinibacillus thermoaerophilus]SDH58818.1 hypothetical protein SAMN04489735_103439 [Aneurinibacillus thermoaerophilus]
MNKVVCVQVMGVNPASLLGMQGGKFVNENFSWDIIVKKYNNFFSELYRDMSE